MLATFVVAVREGVEASLLIGIIAAFLVRQGRSDALRSMWLGIAAAILLCAWFAFAVALLDAQLPQAGQEALETVISLVAVAAIAYMILWIRTQGRSMRASLEASAARALDGRSANALAAVAFFAILREGLETVVFTLAVFTQPAQAAPARIGVLLGFAVAATLGFAIYRGAVRVPLAGFFRVTGAVLVLVAAGLAAAAAHSAHEAGWLNMGQSVAFDLRGILHPGSITAALMTAMFGIRSRPTIAELTAWIVCAIPLLGLVLTPPARTRSAV